MDDRSSRLCAGFLALAVLWVGAFWLWPTSRKIAFGDEKPGTPRALPPALAGVEPAVPSVRPAPVSTEEPVREHIVRKNETLGEIARLYYGSTSFTRFIFEANRDRLRNEDDLSLGQVLRIPHKPGAR